MSKNIKILIATDFTEASDNALNYADAIFRNLFGLDVTYLLVHGFKPLVPYSNTPSMPVIKNDQLQTSLKNKLDELVSNLEKKLGENHQINSYFKIGSLNKVIEKIIDDEKPDLVVMGTREKNAFARMTIGTNTMEVATTASCPVLAIPKEAKADDFVKMTLATDLNELNISSNSFDLLEKLVNFKKSKLEVLHVFSSHDIAEQFGNLEKTAFHQHIKELKHDHATVVNSNVFDGIIDFVNEQKSDMLILSLSERGFLEKIFHADKTEKLVYHAEVPVLILK
ncbi:MAG: universal stress protein [Cyclobacteriaceae bacterium]